MDGGISYLQQSYMNCNIHNLTVKAFGETFSGFWMMAREAGNRIGVDISTSMDVKHHKFDVLAQVCINRPYLTVNDARLCIEHVCGMMFTRQEFKQAKKYILDNWEQIYNETTSR